MARVFISPRAERDLQDISDYIAERSGEERAGDVLRRLAQVMQTQAEYPQGGRLRDELQPGLRSIAIRPYVVFYFPLTDGIDVARVLDGRRNLYAIFAEGE